MWVGKSQELKNEDFQIARSKWLGIHLAMKVPQGEMGQLQVDQEENQPRKSRKNVLNPKCFRQQVAQGW